MTYVTNNVPVFDADFREYDEIAPIRKIVDPNFGVDDVPPADWVIVIPTGGFNDKFYNAALGAARKWKSRVALLSFETPNWFNRSSPYARSPMPTQSWRLVIAQGGAVITIADTGIEPAQRFYGESRKDLFFDFWHPPINDVVATHARPYPEHRKRVTSFVRVQDAHKGAADLLGIEPDVLSGHTLSLVFGRGVDRPYVDALARHFGPAKDFSIELHDRITDREKFDLLTSSSLLLFPSYFEGYGYPPVEAAWMGVPSVAYDLPLLHETVPHSTKFVPLGNQAEFSNGIREMLGNLPSREDVRAKLAIAPDTLSAGQEFLTSLKQAEATVSPLDGSPIKPSDNPPLRGAARNLNARALFEGSNGDLKVHGLTARMEGQKVVLRGQVEGDTSGRRLRFTLRNSSFPDLRLAGPDKSIDKFEVSGFVESWPVDLTSELIRVEVIERGGVLSRKTAVPVKISPDLLFLRRFRFPEMTFARTPRPSQALLCLPVSTLFDSPVGALGVAGVAQALFLSGITSTLLPIDGPISIPDQCDPDFLPLVDGIEMPGFGGVINNIANVLADGGLVIAHAKDAKAWRKDMTKETKSYVLRYPGKVAPDLAILTNNTLTKTQQAKLSKALEVGQLHDARRSRLDRERQHLVLISTPTPIKRLPDAVISTLADLQARVHGLRVALPARLCAESGLQTLFFGGLGTIEVLPENALIRLVEQSKRTVVLNVDGGKVDFLLGSLVPTGGQSEIVTLSEDDPQATAKALAAGLGGAQTDLVKLLGTLIPDQQEHESRALLDTTVIKPRPWVPNHVMPEMTREDGLVFSVPVSDHISGLLEGWGRIDEYGVRATGSVAVVGFRVARHEWAQSSILSLLLRVRDVKDEQIEVRLNGHLVGKIKPSKPGSQSYDLVLEDGVWSDETNQFLTLACRKNGNFALMGIAIGDSKPDEPVWDAIAPDAKRQAPVQRATVSEIHIGAQHPMRALKLTTGWHDLENDGCWTSKPSAAIEFQMPVRSENPVIMTLVGHASGADGIQAQRMGVVHGRNKLADFVLPTEDTSRCTLVLPEALTRKGVRTLFLELPDLMSPKESGRGSDPRQLGVFATRLEFRHTDKPISIVDPGQAGAAFDGSPISLEALPGVLRLIGTGRVPAGIQFMIAGTTGNVSPRRRKPEGWEVNFVLDEALIESATPLQIFALRHRQNGKIVPLPAIEGLEVWPKAGSAKEATPIQIELYGVSMPSDIRNWQPRVPKPRGSLAGLDLSNLGDSMGQLESGWSDPEGDFVWSDGDSAQLTLGTELSETETIAILESGSFLYPGLVFQRQHILYGDDTPAITLINRTMKKSRIPLPLSDQGQESTALTFQFPDAVSPQETGQAQDTRRLSLRLHSLMALPLVPNPAEPDVIWHDPGRFAGATVECLGMVEDGVVLRLKGDGKAPFGIFLDSFRDIIVHPIKAGHGWSANIFFPIGASPHVASILEIQSDAEFLPETIQGEKICDISFSFPE